MVRSNLFVRRRIGLCGESGNLPAPATELCEEIGPALIQEPNVLLVTAGAKGGSRPRQAPAPFAANWYYIVGARRALAAQGRQEGDRVETVLPAGSELAERYFEAGIVRLARGRTREAWHFSFVRGVHALVAVGGGRGTRQLLVLAAALNLPILTIPLFADAAAEHWRDHRPDIQHSFRLDNQGMALLETPASASAPADIAILVRRAVTRSGRRCFMIMPFSGDFDRLYDEVMRPSVESVVAGPVRLDRLRAPGDVTRQIEDGIAAADYVIAVLFGLKPNVLYELGLAHGLQKPAILLRRRGKGTAKVPFDLATQQWVDYDDPCPELAQDLVATSNALAQRPRPSFRLTVGSFPS